MTSNVNAEELLISLTSKYPDLVKPIGDVSQSDSGERFIEMDFECIHLDKIPFMVNQSDEERNCFCTDTLIFDEERETIYLIEFKTGWPKKENSKEIRFKCYEAIAKLSKHWSIFLNKNRSDFFNLKIKYCLITRGSKKQDITHPSFLNVLNGSIGFFKLKTLDNTIVDETRVIINEQDIFSFLSRITKSHSMRYYNKDRSSYVHWSKTQNGTISSSQHLII
ncbi:MULTISPECIES: hypothetical protein [Proteus]|uniref:hypothetical protein n=1 Tax=Proteus TaxID=583 RepID=UPI00137769B9|nr:MULTISPECIES: hypothetical protein [Proteus]NBM92715.1 hypothetical protein [Proteus sp. G2662]